MKKDIIYVCLQLLIFLFYILSPDYIKFNIAINTEIIGSIMTCLGIIIILVAILQLNRSLSPFPRPKKDGTLITNGLYAVIRHPIYLGIILFFFGYSLVTISTIKFILTITIAILFHYKSNYEEALLTQKYLSYKTYQSTTNKIFPFI